MFWTPTMLVIFVPSLNEVTILMPDGSAVIASQVPSVRLRPSGGRGIVGEAGRRVKLSRRRM